MPVQYSDAKVSFTIYKSRLPLAINPTVAETVRTLNPLWKEARSGFVPAFNGPGPVFLACVSRFSVRLLFCDTVWSFRIHDFVCPFNENVLWWLSW